MPEFEFRIDQKETVWRTNHCRIEAKDENEAILKMRSLAFDNDYDLHIDESEIVNETFDDMEYIDNQNQATREIYYKDKMIEDNTPLYIKRDKKINTITNE